MKKEQKGKGNQTQRLAETFCEVMLDMDAKTLVETLTECGVSPKVLAEKSRSVAEKALESFAKDEAERVQDVGRVKTLHEGLGALLVLLRRKAGLSQEDVAVRARVEIKEIRAIETDPTVEPSPRTIFQLEQLFKLPERTLVELSGITTIPNEEFTEEVTRFAADARAMNTLSKEETNLVNAFVKFLSTWSGERRK
jgi:transcriptional regulator with XRE-family HTH domain